jgi:hypothetical protein
LTLHLQPGDEVAIAASATWIRQGSDPIPSLPPWLKSAPTIPIALLDNSIFVEFMSIHTIIKLSDDGARVKIHNPHTGRTSVFAITDLSRLEPTP